MIIYREGEKGNWKYLDGKQNEILDKKIMEYVNKLVIPPAYQKVRIYYEKNPDIVFDGIDAAGRLQQIYSKKWREKADKAKFIGLIDFGKTLPQMTLKIQENIRSLGVSKDKIISIILRITSLCGFRIGQIKYQKLYNSTGLSTLMRKHLKFGKKLKIEFIGKKHMKNSCIIEDPMLISELQKLCKNKQPSDHIFVYPEGHETKLITAIEVNNWLKAYNPKFTTKYFRTFEVNVLLIDLLRKTMPITMSRAQRKKKITEIIQSVSCSINNTPAICKKSYINAELLETYIERPKKFTDILIANNNNSVLNFINFLESIYKNSATN